MVIRETGRRRLVLASIVAALAVLGGACGSSDDSIASQSTDVDQSSSTTSSDATTSTKATTATTATTATSGSSTSGSTGGSPTTLPGKEIDLFTDAGDVLGVVGVAYDDKLNVRAVPGADTEIVATAAPTADNLVATGRARSLPSSIWYEVSVGGKTGWVNVGFVAFIGGTDDATAEYLARGNRPDGETMTDLGRFVAAGFASEEPRSRIVQTVAPTVGDLAEITYDVIGIGDDAQIGYRLHIFATEAEGGESFSLRTIERTALCARGLSGELCV